MISAHVLVKNEARFIWYSVMSVINHVDRVRLWDMGSNDQTKQIIDEIMNSPAAKGKIFFKQLKKEKYFDESKIRQRMLYDPTPLNFQKIRQDMLDATVADWFIVVDGDEVWWEDSIKMVVEEINKKHNQIESIVVPTVNLVGDLYHYQETKAGHYHLVSKVGHYNLRAVNRKIPGLHSAKPHGLWGWADFEGKMIQDRDPQKIQYLDAPYLHATHLRRSGSAGLDRKVFKRSKKLKYEIGIGFPRDYYYPEVFFRPRPKIVPSVWENMKTGFFIRGLLETPLRKINRRIMPAKIGY